VNCSTVHYSVYVSNMVVCHHCGCCLNTKRGVDKHLTDVAVVMTDLAYSVFSYLTH